MNFLNGIWKWTKGHLDWVLLGTNVVVVAVVIYYTVQLSVTTYKYELQNQQLFEQNLQLGEDNGNLNKYNKALGEVISSAIKVHSIQQEVIEKQKSIINLQNEAGKKLFERNRYLEAILSGDIT